MSERTPYMDELVQEVVRLGDTLLKVDSALAHSQIAFADYTPHFFDSRIFQELATFREECRSRLIELNNRMEDEVA